MRERERERGQGGLDGGRKSVRGEREMAMTYMESQGVTNDEMRVIWGDGRQEEMIAWMDVANEKMKIKR